MIQTSSNLEYAQAILNSLTSNIAVLDDTGVIVAVNQAWRNFACKNLLKSTTYCIGQNYLDTCTKSGALAVGEGIRSVLAGMKDEFQFEYPCHSPDEKRWFLMSVSRLTMDERSNPMRVIVAHNNITARKLAEEHANQERAKIQAIFAIAGDGIVVCEDDGRITSSNIAAQRMFGGDEVPLENKNIYDFMSFPEVTEQNDFSEIEVRSINGRTLSVEATSRSFELSGVKLKVLVLRDITERKCAEALVSRVYSTLSHELRSPLASIRGGLALIDGGVIDLNSSEAIELINGAWTSADRLIRLINDYLDNEKLKTGKYVLNLQPVSAKQLLNTAKRELHYFSDQRQLQIEIKIPENLIIDCDEQRILQVLINLLSNAIKHSPHKAVVTLGCKINDQSVRFDVVDTGPGLNSQQQRTLFEPFVNNGATNEDCGIASSGLGLSICRSIVVAHNGTIGITSEPGIGSDFWFELPLKHIPHSLF